MRGIPGKFLFQRRARLAELLFQNRYPKIAFRRLTVAQLDSSIRGPEDLPGLVVGCIQDSTGEDYLRELQIPRRRFDSPRELLQALREDRVNAAIHDAPVLRYVSKRDFGESIQVLPRRLRRENYAFGLASNGPLREDINRQLLKETSRPEWRRTLERYMSP